MLAVLGDFNIKHILDDFILMARDNNERHENNKKGFGCYKHDSGWGIVYQESGKYNLYKNPIPCWEDEKFSEFENKKIVILHARKLSIGKITLENTHPFHARFNSEDWFFCHNGTIKDDLPQQKLKGETDSEKFFHFLLNNFNENDVSGIKKAIQRISDYTALNSFLFNGKYLYAINRFKQKPKYFSMKFHRDEKAVIISSEVLPHIDDWKKLRNGQVARIDVDSLNIKLS